MLSSEVEDMRYTNAMTLEALLIQIRERLRRDLETETQLKPEEVHCEVIELLHTY